MMLTSKQRANLRSLGNAVAPSCQIGKGEISAAQLADLDAQLEKKELVKISVLKTNPLPPEETAKVLAQKLKAETVAVTGSKILLYRKSKSDTMKHLEL